MTYWVSRGAPSEAERTLTTFVKGTSIETEGANEFFGDLLEKVEAARVELESADDPERAVQILQELADLSKEVQAEVERARREADASA